MKPLAFALTATLFFTFYTPASFAQDLSHLIPTAHYTLINTAEDALGLQPPVELTHTPFAGNDGVYSNGIYIGEDPDQGSLILTPFLDALYDSVFAVRLEFKFTDLGDVIRAVVVLGASDRYLGVLTWTDNLFFVLYNNSHYLPIDEMHAMEDRWYEVTIIHHMLNSRSEFYLDGVKVYELNEPLIRSMNDGFVCNTNLSSGNVFAGYWKNLRIYGSEETTGIHVADPKSNGIHGLPTLVKDILSFEYTAGQASFWKITDVRGQVLMSGRPTVGSNEISTTNLIPGMYLIYFSDANDKPVSVEKFVKTD